MERLRTATAEYRATEESHERARQQVVTAVLDALRADVEPTIVATNSPFTAAYIRRLARDAEPKIPPAKPGPKPPRGE